MASLPAPENRAILAPRPSPGGASGRRLWQPHFPPPLAARRPRRGFSTSMMIGKRPPLPPLRPVLGTLSAVRERNLRRILPARAAQGTLVFRFAPLPPASDSASPSSSSAPRTTVDSPSASGRRA